MTAIAVTIAGSDSGGGAGIQADLKTFSALGVYGASVLAALTAQNTLGVTGIHDVPADFIRAQMDAVFTDLSVNAVKIGMLSRPEAIAAVSDGLSAHGAKNVILDPVMVAASGDPLITDTAVDILKSRLFPYVDVITPNLHEAARLLGKEPAANRGEMETQALQLLEFGPTAVLLKGGHGDDPEAADILVMPAGVEWYIAPRLATNNTHGTGCTLSSAIASGLAAGLPLAEAVGMAKAYVTAAIQASDTLSIGRGHGPVHHFHAIWQEGDMA